MREVRRHGFAVVHGLSGHGVGPNDSRMADGAQPRTIDRRRDVLTEGLVLTIEPMISAGSPEPLQDPDGWTIRTRDGSLAAHYEHTLVITRGAPVVLTAA